MKRVIWMAVVAVACGTVGLAARDDDKTITVTGCVQNFSSTGTSGVTERGFLLSNPTIASDSTSMPLPPRDVPVAGVPSGTSGTAAPGRPTSATWAATTGTMTPSSAKAKSSYRLDGQEEELKAQVGHKVEITATVEPKAKDAPKEEPDHLQVSTLKMIASNCTK